MSDDFSATVETEGTATVGGSVAGAIEQSRDRDWFAVELVAGQTYRFDLEGVTLSDPLLHGLYDEQGRYIADTRNDDGGDGLDSRLTFTATYSGTHYVAAGAYSSRVGTYELTVTDLTPEPEPAPEPEPQSESQSESQAEQLHAGAVDLGDISGLGGPQFLHHTLDDGADGVAWFRFTLSEAKEVALGLRQLDREADMAIEDENGVELQRSAAAGTANEWIATTLLAGTYYIRVEAGEAGRNDFALRHGVSEADAEEVQRLEAQQNPDVTPEPEPAPEPEPQSESQVEQLRAGAVDLGDISGLGGTQFLRHTLDDGADGVAWFGFTLSEAKEVALGLRQLDREADLAIEDENGVELQRSAAAGTANEWIATTLLAGTYYIRVEAGEAGRNDFVLRHGVSEADAEEVQRLEAQQNPDVTPEPRSAHQAESLPVLQVADAEADEGPSATVRFRVTLDEPSSEPVTVRYETADGTAVEGGDYEAASGILTFAAGETEMWVEVSVNDDSVEESDESFTLLLSDPTGAAIGDAEAVGTIRNTAPPLPGVPEPAGEDFAADTGTAGRAEVGETVTGTVDTPHDRDWFAISLQAGKGYSIDLIGDFLSDRELRDTYIHGIYDSDGNLVEGTHDDDSGAGKVARLFFSPEESGTYYVAAGAYLSDTGDYRLSVSEFSIPDSDDHPAGTATTAALGEDGTALGTIEVAGDRDWIAVTLEGGTNYRIDLKGSPTGNGTLSDPFLRGIFDANGNRASAERNDDSGTGVNSVVYFTPEDSGTFFVEAGAYDDETGTYTLSVAEVGDDLPDDFANHSGSTGAIAVDGTATGSIDYIGDTDWFSATLEAGQTYRVEMQSPPDSTPAGPVNHVRGVYDAEGALVADFWGTREKYTSNIAFFTAEEDGAYFFEAAKSWHSTGGYSISLQEVDDDFAADTDTTGAVAVGGSATGSIDTLDDRDWFEMTLEAGTAYRIGMNGDQTGDGTLKSLYIRGIHDADGTMIAGTADDGRPVHRNSQITFTPDEDGTYYVAAGAYQDRTGTYTLSVEAVADTI